MGKINSRGGGTLPVHQEIFRCSLGENLLPFQFYLPPFQMHLLPFENSLSLSAATEVNAYP